MSETLVYQAVDTAICGRLGIITLDRPKALNALDLDMAERLDVVLTHWADHPGVDAVLIKSSGSRAFCAGGDVRSIGILPTPAGREALGRAFFRAEYRANWRINTFQKPFISFLGGIAMGGGLGISIHGSHRIVDPSLHMAMPETKLGLFPDVGASWFLARCPGAIGRYLGLIGPTIRAADALFAGLGTHHVPLDTFGRIHADLASAPTLDTESVDAIIARYSTPAEGGVLDARADRIDALFGHDDLETVIEAVERAASEADWIADVRSVLRSASPTSLKASWRRLTLGPNHTIERILTDDYRMAVRMVGMHDFAEGVRAILVDKDQEPKWNPCQLGEISEASVDELLAPLPSSVNVNGTGGGDLTFA